MVPAGRRKYRRGWSGSSPQPPTPELPPLRDFNPIKRIEVLARAGVPATLIHGDIDQGVPIRENSAEFLRRYTAAGAQSLVRLIVVEGQGHN